MKVLLVGLLIGACSGDKGPSQDSYNAPQQFYTPQVKYGGPIVYSGEKPPIIHFPPPPEVSDCSIHITFFYSFLYHFSHLIQMEAMEVNIKPHQL